MINLNKDQLANLLPCYQGKTPLELQFALELQYAYHGENGFGPHDCPVFADDAENPNIVLVGTSWAYLMGNAAYGKSDADLYGHILGQLVLLPAKKHMVLNVCSPGWEAKLEKLFARHIKDRWIRYNYRLNKASFSRHAGWREKIPAGFEMRYSVNARGNFSFALMKNDEKISECSVVYFEKEAHDARTARVVEIGIETKKEYRRRGFAFLTCAAFIEYCLSHDLVPNWGCWNFNPDSQALAKKLGFEEISQRSALILKKRKTIFGRRRTIH